VGLALAVLLGTAAQLQQPQLWPPVLVLVLALCAASVVALGWRGRQRWAVAVALWLAVAALAFALTAARAHHRLAQALPSALEGQDLVLTGTVVSLPRESALGTRFHFQVDGAQQAGQAVAVPSKVALGWMRGPDDDALLGAPLHSVKAGQRWRLVARLRQPHGSVNPHGFDFELWMFEQGLRASGYVRDAPAIPAALLDDSVFNAPVQRLRQTVRDAIAARIADPALAGVLAALAVGDQGAIERADWDVFRTTGVAHLMSISGLHVTMFAWLVGGLAAPVWRWFPRALFWLPAPQAARWAGLAAALAYAVLAGWGVPAQRTVCMLAVVVVLRSAGLRWPLFGVLLAAATGVVVIDPWALLQVGFWLSFVAVALLVWSEPVQGLEPPPTAPGPGQKQAPLVARVWAACKDGLRSQAVATVGLAPLSMVFFQQVSVVGFVANLVAIPLVTLLITPLALLGMVAPPLWTVGAGLVQGLMAALHSMAQWPWAVWTAGAAPLWAVACGLLAAGLALTPLPWRLRACAVPLVLPLLAPPLQRPQPGQFEVVVTDVGQGTAVLVRTAQHVLLYDTGPQYTPDSDAGLRVLLPLLRARGESELHLLMLSHRDTDHVGGAAALLAALRVHRLSSSLEPEHPLLLHGVAHHPCHAGQRWQWDGVTFEVLHPLAEDLPTAQGRPAKPNALSCVLRVHAGARSVLLTGDLEAAQEARLVAAHRAGEVDLRSQLLVVPHHGSRTSSTASFVAAVQPQAAVVQAAYRSRFGHPAADVMARYARQGVPVYQSDRCGALSWPAAAPISGLTCQRAVGQRYWHHPIGRQGGVASPPGS
jgi:competence protein ComEC